MAIAFLQEFAPTGDTSTKNYDAVASRLNESGWPEGALVHTAGFAPDGVFRIYDVWDSKENLDAFLTNVLTPIIEELFANVPDATPPTKEETYELHDSRIGS